MPEESQNLLREFKIWLNNNNIYLTFLEELFIFNIGSLYSSADLHIFIIVKYYIFAAKRLTNPIHSSTAKKKNKTLLHSNATYSYKKMLFSKI